MSRPGNDIDEDRKLSRFLTMETEAERMKRELKEEGATKSTFWRIVKETRPEWPLLIPCLIMNAVYGLVMPAFTLIYNYLFEIFKLTDLEELKQKSIFASLLFVGLGFFGAIIMLVSITMYGLLMESVTKRMRLKTFVNLVKQDVAFFDLPQHGTGKLCMRLATDAPNVKNALDWRLGTCAEAFMSVVLGMVLAIVFGWKLAVPLVFLSPLLFLGMFLEVYIREKTVDSDVKLMEEAGKVSSEAIQNVRTVQALVKQDTFYDMYCGHLDEPFKHLKRQGLVHALALGYANSIGYFFYAAGVALGALFVGFGWFSPLVVFKVVFLIQFSTFSVGFAASFFPEFYKARMSAGLIFKLCDIKPKIDSFSTEGSRPGLAETAPCVVFIRCVSDGKTLEGEINFSHVSFSYDLRPTFKVLRELNFNLEKGKSLALVGPSGCGKSTVVSLLLRFYDSNEGVIRLDGYGIRTLNVTHLRREQAVVAQEPVLFNTSIMHNIIYGLEETVSEAEMLPLAEKCAKQANIHEFIVGLPEGYNTSVGNRGTQLSGGQRQRIAIARALAREPTVLLLDEATSALDTEAEKVVQAALDAASAGRTCITIAHRLSTIVNADHIAVVRNGAIVEYGTHESLMAENGLYNQMVQHQNLLEANKPRDSDV